MRTQLKKNEKVILITGLHWFPALFSPMLFATICFVVGIWISSYGYLMALFALMYGAYKIIEWQRNIWVVTNLRVIDENGFLTHYSTECPLDKINNVSYSQSFKERNWGYGNVAIQTAAGHGLTTYVGVKNPKQLKDTITTMQEEYKKALSMAQAKEFANAFTQSTKNGISVSSELEKIFELKEKGVLSDEEYLNLKAKIINS